MSRILDVKNLFVEVDGKQILQGINLTINPGEIHVIMGPNGAGKSTLANAIMAHPAYSVSSGDIFFKDSSILKDTADERARKGIFMSFQSPQEVPGITVEDFLRASVSAVRGENLKVLKFKKELLSKMSELKLDENYASRYLNVGFSGGEKKKLEILQMQMLDPTLVLLDETDSGLDVDAVRIVSDGISNFLDENKAAIIITHHNEILSSVEPTHVHVVIDGKLVKNGDKSIIDRIHKEGYAWIKEEING